jgi:hypothetical protein
MDVSKLSRKYIKKCRLDPALFYANESPQRSLMLDRFYEQSADFVLKRRDCTGTPFFGIHGPLIYSDIDGYLALGLWYRAAQVMDFFKVPHFRMTQFMNSDKLIAMMAVFEFGCFDPQFCRGARIENAMGEWCHGRIGQFLIRIVTMPLLNTPDWLFESILAKLATQNYTTYDASDIINELKPDPVNYDRRAKIVAILAQKRFALSEDESRTTPYLYLMRANFPIPKPLWTRTRHLQLANSNFREETRTILLMRKWRFDNFPLHKDLVDTLLLKLFELHLDDAEKLLAEIKETYEKVSTWRVGQKSRFCLKQGVPSTYTTGEFVIADRIADAVHLSFGIPIDASRYKIYQENLRLDLCRAAFLKEPHNGQFYVSDRGKWIVDYCKMHDIDLFDIMKRRIILKVDANGDAMTHYPGITNDDSDEEWIN